MRTLKVCAVTGVLFTLPLAAFAQSADSKYCHALADKYAKYRQDNQDAQRGSQPASSTVGAAVSKCDSAPGEGIPALEKALTDAKIALPARM